MKKSAILATLVLTATLAGSTNRQVPSAQASEYDFKTVRT